MKSTVKSALVAICVAAASNAAATPWPYGDNGDCSTEGAGCIPSTPCVGEGCGATKNSGNIDELWANGARTFDQSFYGINDDEHPVASNPPTPIDAPKPETVPSPDPDSKPAPNNTETQTLKKTTDRKTLTAVISGLVGTAAGSALIAGLARSPEILTAVGMGAAGVFFGFSLLMLYKLVRLVAQGWGDVPLLPVVLNSLGMAGGILLGSLCLLNPLIGGIAVSGALAATGLALAGALTPNIIKDQKKLKTQTAS